ncbi:DUF1398 domain-containing protein [Emticicia sp. 17c]|uniref:DUF1398 domain-containing protein n=1 Tax=Emticicia sp. 17c TaxID=3127704 RepID=UPI00301C0A22
MFTLEQIKTAHAKVKSGADFPKYIQELKQLGIVFYETYVSDGHTHFVGQRQEQLTSAAKYTALTIAEQSDTPQFIAELKAHQAGQTDYPAFCDSCARLGINKWVVSMEKMTCTYYNKAGHELLVEEIPQ